MYQTKECSKNDGDTSKGHRGQLEGNSLAKFETIYASKRQSVYQFESVLQYAAWVKVHEYVRIHTKEKNILPPIQV